LDNCEASMLLSPQPKKFARHQLVSSCAKSWSLTRWCLVINFGLFLTCSAQSRVYCCQKYVPDLDVCDWILMIHLLS
jgi:hypothetical protein